MKKLASLFLAGITFAACTEISFKEPQPAGVKSLDEIPTRFQGKYLQDNDTVTMFEKGVRGLDRETGKVESLTLSDSIVLKKYKNLYFISYRDGNVWLLRILTRKQNGDLCLSAIEVPDDETKRKEFFDRLSKETPVIESESHFIIEPSSRKLYRLYKKGFFKEEDKPWLRKIN